MTEDWKPLLEWDVRPGDRLNRVSGEKITVARVTTDAVYNETGCHWELALPVWRILSRAPRDNTPKLWRDMTDAEKGALLLAHHEGKVIEFKNVSCEAHEWQSVAEPVWAGAHAYRVRPEPKVEAVTIKWHGKDIMGNQITDDYRITFNLIDGKPDPASIKMETLE